MLKINQNCRSVWTLSLLVLAFSASASATTVNILFDAAYSTPITVDRTVDGGGSWFLQDPGQFHFITEAGSPTDIPPDFYTFCIEPREFLNLGQLVSYNEVPIEQGATNIGGMGTTKANFIREFLYRYYADFSVPVDVVTGAAIQVSLWEIVRENSGTFDLSAGDVQFRSWSNTAVLDLATTMLDSLTGNGPYLTNVDALALAGGTQDALVQFTSSPTPEPSTVLLGAAGLVLIAFRRRLRGVR
jgi:hypothetical protein